MNNEMLTLNKFSWDEMTQINSVIRHYDALINEDLRVLTYLPKPSNEPVKTLKALIT